MLFLYVCLLFIPLSMLVRRLKSFKGTNKGSKFFITNIFQYSFLNFSILKNHTLNQTQNQKLPHCQVFVITKKCDEWFSSSVFFRKVIFLIWLGFCSKALNLHFRTCFSFSVFESKYSRMDQIKIGEDSL